MDKDQIIAVSGIAKKEFMDKHISSELEKVINSRNPLNATRDDDNFVSIIEDDNNSDIYNYELIVPIISEGDILGAIIMLSNDNVMTIVEEKLAKTASDFLGKQMEQ